MITPEEFVARWGEAEGLIRFDPAIVESLSMSRVSKRFLIEAGLPRNLATLRFGFPSNQLPPAPGLIPGFELMEDYSRYRLLGVDVYPFKPETYNGLFCLDDQDKGKVVSIGHPNIVREGVTYIDEEAYFVEPLNTNVGYLAEMLLLIEEDQRWRMQQPKDYDVAAAYDHFTKVARYAKSGYKSTSRQTWMVWNYSGNRVRVLSN